MWANLLMRVRVNDDNCGSGNTAWVAQIWVSHQLIHQDWTYDVSQRVVHALRWIKLASIENVIMRWIRCEYTAQGRRAVIYWRCSQFCLAGSDLRENLRHSLVSITTVWHCNRWDLMVQTEVRRAGSLSLHSLLRSSRLDRVSSILLEQITDVRNHLHFHNKIMDCARFLNHVLSINYASTSESPAYVWRIRWNSLGFKIGDNKVNEQLQTTKCQHWYKPNAEYFKWSKDAALDYSRADCQRKTQLELLKERLEGINVRSHSTDSP